MKDLFETLIGLEEASVSPQRKGRKLKNHLEAKALREYMNSDIDTSLDIELALEQESRSSILEDFDFDRDFQEASLDMETTIDSIDISED